tara:strand:+ start:1919 stop:2311 length:393 start_codon:yes stop_codon:yes gene_type:complete
MSGEKIYISFPFDETAGNTAEEYFGFDERVELVGATYTDKDGVAANNSNYLVITLENSDGSKVYFSHDTRAANQGAITAKTPTALAAGANVNENIIDAGTCLAVKSVPAGSGKAMDGTITVIAKKARLFS